MNLQDLFDSNAGRRFHQPGDEQKQRLSASAQGNKNRQGKLASNETRAKMSQSLKGKSHPQTDETRAKISAANTGKKLSEETKEKLRQANIGKKVSDETRAKLSKPRGGLSVHTPLGQFDTLKAAAQAHGWKSDNQIRARLKKFPEQFYLIKDTL